MKFPNKRVCASLIDFLLVEVVTLPLGILLSFFIYIGYFLMRDALFKGKSIGKLLVGLTVVDLDRNKCTLQESILRNIIFIIPIVSYVIEYIVMTVSNEGKRLGDLLAKTTVEDDRPHIGDGWFLLFSILLVIVVAIIKIGYAFYFVSKIKGA